ncbi:MAG: hypothetical protein J3K34DRAFT_444132 [Monoraphidium minutum]|nr:MAG: hypothetical protein J3K34DRAFT_444132 [Monoraphidium minutum]
MHVPLLPPPSIGGLPIYIQRATSGLLWRCKRACCHKPVQNHAPTAPDPAPRPPLGPASTCCCAVPACTCRALPAPLPAGDPGELVGWPRPSKAWPLLLMLRDSRGWMARHIRHSAVPQPLHSLPPPLISDRKHAPGAPCGHQPSSAGASPAPHWRAHPGRPRAPLFATGPSPFRCLRDPSTHLNQSHGLC